jgi:alanine-synthesizing transaminase
MLSRRTQWDLTPNRLATLVHQKRAAGAPLLDLTESNPTQAGLLCPADLLAALAAPSAARYEPDPRGFPRARAAVSADYRRRGSDVPADRIILTASTSEAYAFLFKLLCDAGDRILVPRPSYPLFEYLAHLESADVDSYPLRYDGEWHLVPSALEESIGPRTRAIVVVHPNNPTGSFLKRDEQTRLQRLAAERNLAIISDEVFADYAFAPDPRRDATLAGEPPCLSFSLGGLSKSCGLPQLKLGWLAVSGPLTLREEALARLEVVADTYLSVGTPVQHALPAILARGQELQAPIEARIRGNLDMLSRRIERGSAATLLHVEGGWSAVLRLPAHHGEAEWAIRLLEGDDVIVHPGYFFDFEEDAFVVVSLLTPPDALEEGLERIVRRLERA